MLSSRILGEMVVLAAVAASGQEPARPERLATSVWIDRAQVRVGEAVTVGVVVRNPGPEPVFQLDVEWLPGEALEADRVTRWFSLGPAPRSRFDVLEPGEGFLVRGRLTARQEGERVSPAVLVQWRERRNGPVAGLFATVPPISIATKGRWWSRIPVPLPVLLPILATLLVAALGWWFTQRVERQKERFSEKVERQKEHLETFLAMQTKVLQIAESHYLPIGSAVKTLQGRLRDFDRAKGRLEKLEATGADIGQQNAARQEQSVALGLAFAAFVLLHHRDYRLTHKVGGWVFLDRVGEEAADAAWECFREAVLDRFDKIALGRMIEAVGEAPTLSGMIVDFDQHQAHSDPAKAVAVSCWRDLHQTFGKWITSDRTDFEARMHALDAFAIILHLETNRFYAPLYGPKERFPGADDGVWIERLAILVGKLGERPDFDESAAKLAAYIDRLQPQFRT